MFPLHNFDSLTYSFVSDKSHMKKLNWCVLWFVGSKFAGRVSLRSGPSCYLAVSATATTATSTSEPSFLVQYCGTTLRFGTNFQLNDASWSSSNTAMCRSRNDKPFQSIGSRTHWWWRSPSISSRIRLSLFAGCEVPASGSSPAFLTLLSTNHLSIFHVRYGWLLQGMFDASQVYWECTFWDLKC